MATEESARYEADFLPNSHLNAAGNLAEQRLLALLEATRQGQSVAQFMGWSQPRSATDQDSQNTLLWWHLFGEPTDDFSRQMLQCDICGRLLVEIGKTNRFTTFLPEDAEKARHILSADQWKRLSGPDSPAST